MSQRLLKRDRSDILDSTANSISAANDLTSLAPKYINIKRGQILAVTVSAFLFMAAIELISPGRRVWLRSVESARYRRKLRKSTNSI